MNQLNGNPDVLVHSEYLQHEFEVAASTVLRWYKGISRPHPKIEKLILNYIDELNEVRKYWLEIDLETGNPVGGVCWAYYKDDKPIEGYWILVKEEKQ